MNDLNLVFVLGPKMHRAALACMQQVFAYYIYIYIYISHIFGFDILVISSY